MARLWQVYAAIFLALAAGYFLVADEALSAALYCVIGLSCVTAILAGIVLHKPAAPVPWYLMAAGQAAWVVGDAVYTLEQGADTVTFPAPSDIAYLASYPLLATAVILLIRAQHRARDLAGLVDSVIVTAGIGLLSWAFIAGPILHDSTTSQLGNLLAVAYPAGDIVILALLMTLMTGQGSWTPAFRLLVAATLLLLAADMGFATSLSESSYAPWLDLLWLVSYVLWGAAALHPDMVNLAVPAVSTSTPFSARRMIILSGVVLLPVVLFIARETVGLRVDMGTLVIGAATLSLLVMARMACAIDEIRHTTRQRDDLHEDLFRRATQDEVTGLPNRPSFVRLVGAALERGVRDGSTSALIVIEVGGTGEVAQRHGYSYGDAVLGEVARRIEGVVERQDSVARIGPHQFGVMIDRLGPQADLPGTTQRLLAACRAPISINGRPTSLSAHAGVAVSVDSDPDPEVLLREATLATASARAGGGGVEFFDAFLREEVMHRNEIEVALHEALRAGQLEVYYQPLLAVGPGTLSGYEALVRWNRPGHGLVPPDSFIPIAEKSDLICELDGWVLREATRQLARWTRADPRQCGGLTVSVNVSGRNLASSTIVPDVAEALRLSGLDPCQLTLEITETVLVDVPRATAQMSALRQLGVGISIDDFGTGYTSIGQLGQLSADVIKVDRSLVTSPRAGARELLALIVQVGHASGLLVVAEGIERLDQLATVTELHFDSAQGYLLGRPQPVCDGRPPELQTTNLSPLATRPSG